MEAVVIKNGGAVAVNFGRRIGYAEVVEQLASAQMRPGVREELEVIKNFFTSEESVELAGTRGVQVEVENMIAVSTTLFSPLFALGDPWETDTCRMVAEFHAFWVIREVVPSAQDHVWDGKAWFLAYPEG